MDILDLALRFTLGNEGGYSNHPHDLGGATNWGIIQRTLDHWVAAHPESGFPHDVKDLTLNQATAIYRAYYWRGGEIADLAITDPAISIKLFDIGVNCGLTMAAKILQRAVNSIPGAQVLSVDGRLGAQTLGAANAQDPDVLMDAICKAQADHYNAIVTNNPSQAVFIKGWLARAARKPEVSDEASSEAIR
jgi:lysozyme family protein